MASGLNFRAGKALRSVTDITIHRPGQRAYSTPLYGPGNEQVGEIITTLTCFIHSPPVVTSEIVWKEGAGGR